MLLARGSNIRARGPSNRSRGSRGRGGSSRGATNSSGKSNHSFQKAFASSTGPRKSQNVSRAEFSVRHGSGKHPKFTNRYSLLQDPFEQERNENAAKREQQRGPQQNNTMVNGRGGRGRGGPFANKQVRFADTPNEQNIDPFRKSTSPAPANPFTNSTNANTSAFPEPANTAFNPFASKQDVTTATNPFSASASKSTIFSAKPNDIPSPNPFSSSNTANNPFGAPSQKSTSTSVFGTPAPLSNNTGASNPFGGPSQPSNPTTNLFSGLPGTSNSNPFAQPLTSIFGAPMGQKTTSASTNSSTGTTRFPSGAASSTIHNLNNFPQNTPKRGPNAFDSPSNGTARGFSQPKVNGMSSKTFYMAPKPSPHQVSTTIGTASSTLAAKIDKLLRKEKILAPPWPKSPPNHPNFRTEVENYWRLSKDYRAKVRTALIKEGLFDDPNKPKKLSEAIDFNGTCEDMCPEFEKGRRIVERSLMGAELETVIDGQSFPNPDKMVKAFARSAAGQDAPLPMDVRSPAALRRTLDYLLQTVMGDEENLPKVHGFIWDRTREIRRDFVFQQASMNSTELPDQIYCLEYITKFHVIALHHMSKKGVATAEEFSEQQEVEQLGKTLLSLIQTYDDCKVQGVESENEAEFRSYYALLNGRSPGILQTVQDWGWKFWGESDQIRTAVTLVESLQNTWDPRGPLKPHTVLDIAQNAYSRYFNIVADKKVSYTMACFAEVHFNSLRRSILKTILLSYRKQREQTKDWTVSKLNQVLRFDDESDVVEFAEAYGLCFDEVEGEEVLSFDSEADWEIAPLKQKPSYNLVERKRGRHSLLELIYSTVYDEEKEEDYVNKDSRKSSMEDEEDGLFVKDDTPVPTSTSTIQVDINTGQMAEDASVEEASAKPASLFDRISSSKSFNPGFFKTLPTELQPSQTASREDSNTLSPAKTPSTFPFPPKPALSTTITKPEGNSNTAQIMNPSSSSEKLPDFATIFSKPSENKAPSTSAKTNQIQPSLFNFVKTPPPAIASSDTEEPLPNQKPGLIPGFTEHPETLSAVGHESISAPPSVSITPSSPILPPTQFTSPQISLFDKSSTPLSDPTPKFPSAPMQKAPIPQSAASPSFQSLSQPIKATDRLDRSTKMERLTNWITLGHDGLLEHFTEITVENILREAVSLYNKEIQDETARDAHNLAIKEADQYRLHFLSTKYFKKWRVGAYRSWQKRKGRENRQAMRDLAQSMRVSKAARSASLVEDFKASTRRGKGENLESLIGTTGVLDGVHDPNKQIEAIAREEKGEQQQTATGSTQSTSKHRRGKSNDPIRRSLMSDPSYLNGGSRIHLMSNYDMADENRRQVSGVQTDYFRLKARGIATLPNGLPLASTAARDILHRKCSFDGALMSSTPRPLKHASPPRSVPSKLLLGQHYRSSSLERDEHIRDLKERAKAVLSEDRRSQRKRSLDESGEDDVLFERAKRVREQLDEGMQWFRQENERYSRSMS